MVWFWIVAAVATLGGLGLLYLDGRRRERAIARDWELVLTPKGESELQRVDTRLRGELALTDLAYNQAFSAHDIGYADDAIRLLDLGCSLIQKFAPTLLKSLAAMAVLSRMLSAMAPVKPLRARRLKLRQLASLAYLNQLIHYFLVTTGERFRLRVAILARCVAMVPRLVFQSTERVKAGLPETEPEWEQLKAARHDLRVLTDESLESFRLLLMSMAAERRTP